MPCGSRYGTGININTCTYPAEVDLVRVEIGGGNDGKNVILICCVFSLIYFLLNRGAKGERSEAL